MRQFCAVIALLLALQPALMLANGGLCGQANCEKKSTVDPVCGQSCCDPEALTCCCEGKSQEVPRQPTEQLEVGQLLIHLLQASSTRLEVKSHLEPICDRFLAPYQDDRLSGHLLTHNERLALHCVLRT